MSLYGLFAAPAIDPGLPQQAYGALLALLGIGRMRGEGSARWVYATTNYDTIGEAAIHANSGLPDAGDISFDTSAERAIKVERLLDGMPRFVPVLHLHGRVGWFRRDNGSFSSPVNRYKRSAGTPIIMLPDLEKVYENVGIIEPLWEQFEEALQRAKRVFVLGHSLHDRALVRALVNNVEPLQRLAVTYLPSDSDPSSPADKSAASVRQCVGEQLPGATPVPMRFEAGVNLETPELRGWLDTDID